MADLVPGLDMEETNGEAGIGVPPWVVVMGVASCMLRDEFRDMIELDLLRALNRFVLEVLIEHTSRLLSSSMVVGVREGVTTSS